MSVGLFIRILLILLACQSALTFAAEPGEPDSRVVLDGVEVFTPVFEPRGRQIQPFFEMKKVYEIPSTIRVQIFPHHGRYAAPQGAEKVATQVELLSEGPCALADSVQGLAVEAEPVPAVGHSYVFQLSELTETVWLRCPQRTKLVREEGLTSYEYEGLFEVKPGLNPRRERVIRVIQHVPFEEYLKGVVPAEMPARWPLESLKAQAVAARTYALFQFMMPSLELAATPDIDVDDTVMFQAYLGLSHRTKSTDRAVEETAGKVILHNGSPIEAFFAADSGGYTELAVNVWNKAYAYTPSKPEVYDLSWFQTDWTVTFAISVIESRLRNAGVSLGRAKLRSVAVRPTDVNISGRVMQVELGLTDGSTRRIFGPDFQRYMRFKSNLFVLSQAAPAAQQESTVTFNGRGFGHGVGMNQWGAKVLVSKLGWTWQQILNFYYEGVSIRALPVSSQ